MFTLTEWCARDGHDLTFIEVMPMGDLGNEDRLDQYWSLKDLRARLAERFTLTDLAERSGGPARTAGDGFARAAGPLPAASHARPR